MNAARKDQATDRVYRLGQKRAVQIFKLATEGRPQAPDDGQRGEEDDPKLAKIFSREGLLEMPRLG